LTTFDKKAYGIVLAIYKKGWNVPRKKIRNINFDINYIPLIFAVSASSGTGKTSVINQVVKCVPNVVRSISVNTRPKRKDEQNGVDYFFVSNETFDFYQLKGKFIEYTEIYGERRGTLKSQLMENSQKHLDTICVVEWNGARNLKKIFGETVISIFLLPPSIAELKKRLTKRNQDSHSEIDSRFLLAQEEMKYFEEYDYCVVNDDFDRCVKDVSCIVLAERNRVFRHVRNVSFS
jgi:guanylate kinase